MRKGFTLIELLAVIVILAIIALIAVPIVINIINDSKYESQKRSIDHYAKAVEQAAADYQIKNNKKVEGRFNTTDGKTLTREDTTLNVDYKGNVVCNKIIVNKDGSIYVSECIVDGDRIDYELGNTTYGMLAEKTNSNRGKFLSTEILSSNISKLTIHTDGINITDEYESIDCSGEQDKSVMCYWKGIENKEGFYEMHIASDGEIYTPVDSSWLFYNLGDKSTDFTELDLTGINTKYTKNMSHMFQDTGRYMTKFNLGPNFDTSNVTDMSYMFHVTAMESLTKLDLRDKFDTSNVTNMSNMFTAVGSFRLKTLDLGDKFDTSNVTNMEHMFQAAYSSAMKNLNLGPNFNTSKVTNMYRMFAWLSNLEILDLGSKFDMSNGIETGGMFEDCGTNGILTKVVVSSDNIKTKILNNTSTPQFWKDNNIIVVQSS